MTPALILALVQCLPSLVILLDKMMGGITQDKINAFADTLQKTIDQIEKAKTDQEKKDAARSFVSTVSKLK